MIRRFYWVDFVGLFEQLSLGFSAGFWWSFSLENEDSTKVNFACNGED